VFRDDGTMLVTLIINHRVLDSSLPDWIAYRDASPYRDDGKGIKLISTFAGGENYKGLLHTLTHEAAHIYDYIEHVTPFVERHLAAPGDSPEAKEFTRGIWAAYSVPAAAYAIPRLTETAAYGLGKALPRSIAAEQYAALAKTPFASLYGAGSWAEDFAEAATWAWLGKEDGIKYSVTVMRGERELATFAPGLGPTTQARQAALSVVLE